MTYLQYVRRQEKRAQRAAIQDGGQTAEDRLRETARASLPSAAAEAGVGPGAKSRRGRPSVFEPGVAARICEQIRQHGLTDTEAAVRSGVASSTISRWKALDEDFADDLLLARADYHVMLATRVRTAVRRDGTADWRAAAWLLQRQFPEIYGNARRPPASVHPAAWQEPGGPSMFTDTAGMSSDLADAAEVQNSPEIHARDDDAAGERAPADQENTPIRSEIPTGIAGIENTPRAVGDRNIPELSAAQPEPSGENVQNSPEIHRSAECFCPPQPAPTPCITS